MATLAPALDPDLVAALAARPVTALAMDAVPRISRAQSLDVLSSMANIAGYRAVIEAAHAFGRFFTGQVTAAGKVPPAKVLVAGAGVAGLAAIGAASSLGAIVRATDVRPEVADQIASMGGEYVGVPAEEPAEGAQAGGGTGYASVTSPEDLLERYRQLVDALLDSPAIAGFCYTQMTDTLQEKNGLLTEDRKPKVDPALVRSITRRPSAAVPADEIASFEYGDYPPSIMDPQ